MYTYILDLNGGTYVGQAAGLIRDGLCVWLSKLELPGFRANDMKSLIESFLEDQPTPLDGLKNVWCISGLAGERLALVHIIKTSMEAQNSQFAIRSPQSKNVP